MQPKSENYGRASDFQEFSNEIWPMGFPGGSEVNNLPANAADVDWEYPLEEEMATHSSILAWRIPCTEEPGGLLSMGTI